MISRTLSPEMYSDYLMCPALFYYNYLKGYLEITEFKITEQKLYRQFSMLLDQNFNNIPISESYLEANNKLQALWKYYLENYSDISDGKYYSEQKIHILLKYGYEKVFLKANINRIQIKDNKVICYIWQLSKNLNQLHNIIVKNQNQFYAYAISKFTNISDITIKNVYFLSNEEVIHNFSDSEINKIEDKIFSVIKKTQPTKKLYIPDPVILKNDIPICQECNYYNLCQEYL